jgi:hypothetical protein
MSGGWPELELASWQDTRDTLHMWTQIVGKVRLALAPMVNHWWQVALYVTARGLSTSLMSAGPVDVDIEFDFVEHALVIRTTAGDVRRVALEPRSVASFYDATIGALADVGAPVSIWPSPVEVVDAIPFTDDVTHHDYDGDAARRFWLQLVRAHEVMARFRGRFIGKSSPVHFFWGAPDLAVTRFSGRTAPKHPGGVPHCPDWVQELAYSHEVHSCGFWPGGEGEGSFYAYAYPQPDGFADWSVAPDAAYFDKTLGEFVLPYREVRAADDPEATLLAFFQSTYDAAADLAGWDRAALEAPA